MKIEAIIEILSKIIEIEKKSLSEDTVKLNILLYVNETIKTFCDYGFEFTAKNIFEINTILINYIETLYNEDIKF